MIAPNNHSTKSTRKKPICKLATIVTSATLILIVAIVAAMFIFSRNDDSEKSKQSKRATTITEAKPAVASHTNAVEVTQTQQHDPTKRYEDGVEVVAENVRTNSSGAVIEKLTLADGSKISKIHPPKPVFDNPADQVIALAISTKPGESMPPLPDISNIDKDFADSLLAPIKINEDDPEDVKELKAKVLETKAYLIEEVKNGGSVYDALIAHQKGMEDIADSHLMAIQELQRIRAEGDMEMAREFAERVNESFRVRGIPEIPVPGNNNSTR